MFAYIKGSFEELHDGIVVIDNDGMGYEINTSSNTIAQMPQLGSEVKLYTKLIPREDSLTLYGFFTSDEKMMFELLLSVNGIGPKAALSILSTMTVGDIKFAVLGGDAKAFASAPGVGKKTAERAIIDLKDKVDLIDAFEDKLTSSGGVASANTKSSSTNSVRGETLEALVALGYSPSTAAKAIDSMTINDSTTVEQLLSDTLKQMSFL